MPKYWYITIFILIIVVLTFSGFSCKSAKPLPPVSLSFWGFEPEQQAWSAVISAFQTENPSISISYKQVSEENYEWDLVNALAENRGPDIFMVQSRELRGFKDKIAPFPGSIIDSKQFSDTFVGTAQEDLIIENKIYALPLYIDVLSLYYNKDIFNTKTILSPPKTWQEFNGIVKKITAIDLNGKIQLAGVALGASDNIENSADILSLLMLQQGTEMLDQSRTRAVFNQSLELEGETYYPGERALEFYTSYANPERTVYTWNKTMDSDIKAFAQNKAGMIFGFLSDREKILALSPKLNFGIAPVPQISGTPIDINYAKYNLAVVSARSLKQSQAFEFLDFAASQKGTKIFLEKSLLPCARRDLITWQTQDRAIGSAVPPVLTARTWYQKDEQAVQAIFAEMISSYLSGRRSLSAALDYGADKVSALMR